jgi:radical SAM protein with 4Fe4S-binding SPASM domain
MSVSLDGHCSDVNDATRGRGAFQRATRGIRNLVEAGIQTGVLLVLTKRNVWALEETVEEVRRLGASSLSIGYLAPMGRGAGCCTGLSITASERRAAEGVIRRLQASNTGFVHEGFSYWDDYPRRLQCAREADCKAATSGQRCLLPCDAAKTFCAITADGWVLPCNKFDTYRCGNMREQSLSAIWQGPAMSRIRALSERPVGSVAACGSCTYHPICAGGCRALAYRAFGDLEAPDPSCAVLPDSAVHTLGSH